jgi:hypothetical protein
MSYGMAWVIQDYRGETLWSHAGVIDGFRAHLTMAPKHKLGIVILASLHQTRMNLALSNTLVDLSLGLPRKDWGAIIGEAIRKGQAAEADRLRARDERRRRDAKPSRELAAYVGSYENPAYGTAKVTLEKGGLVWSWGKFTSPLEHFHFDVFSAALDEIAEPQVVFRLDGDGNVSALFVEKPMDAEFQKAPSR